MKYSENGLFLDGDVTQFIECGVTLRVLPVSGLDRRSLHSAAAAAERQLRARLRDWARYCPRADHRRAHSALTVYYSVVRVEWDFWGLVGALGDELPTQVRLYRCKSGQLPRKVPVPLAQYWQSAFTLQHQLPLYSELDAADGGPLQGY